MYIICQDGIMLGRYDDMQSAKKVFHKWIDVLIFFLSCKYPSYRIDAYYTNKDMTNICIERENKNLLISYPCIIHKISLLNVN